MFPEDPNNGQNDPFQHFVGNKYEFNEATTFDFWVKNLPIGYAKGPSYRSRYTNLYSLLLTKPNSVKWWYLIWRKPNAEYEFDYIHESEETLLFIDNIPENKLWTFCPSYTPGAGGHPLLMFWDQEIAIQFKLTCC